jgi:hypothetical protein
VALPAVTYQVTYSRGTSIYDEQRFVRRRVAAERLPAVIRNIQNAGDRLHSVEIDGTAA